MCELGENMDLIPDEELRNKGSFNLAPMVDFLFLILAVFATIAVTKATLFDSEVSLVRLVDKVSDTPAENKLSLVNLSVTSGGEYKWITEFHEFSMENISAIENELMRQEQLGLLPRDHKQTRILLHIDRKAEWEPVAELLFALKKTGFFVSPVYEMEEAV